MTKGLSQDLLARLNEEKTEVKGWIRLTLPLALILFVLMFIGLPFASVPFDSFPFCYFEVQNILPCKCK